MASRRIRRGSVMSVGRCSNWRWRPPVAWLRIMGGVRLVSWVSVVMLRSNHVRLLHWGSRKCRCLVCLAHARLGIHALDRYNPSQSRVGGRLRQFWLSRLRSGVVRYQVQVLASRGRDAKRLLHKTIGLVSVSFRFAIVVVFVTTATRFGSLAVASSPSAETATSLAFHFAVRQKAAGYSAGAP